MEDAWASIGEEGRGQLRKAPGISKHDKIRRYPNGATRHAEGMTHVSGPTQRTETSKYLQEKKEKSISRVVASEKEIAQTGIVAAMPGL